MLQWHGVDDPHPSFCTNRFEFYMEEEDPKSIVLRVFPGKFLDSSLIDIDAHPTFIRLTIKGKVKHPACVESVWSIFYFLPLVPGGHVFGELCAHALPWSIFPARVDGWYLHLF